MTIIPVEDLEFLEDVSNEDSTLERRDSLRDSPYSDGTLDGLESLVTLRDTIRDRGTVCKHDAMMIEELSQENSALAIHVRQYPSVLYTESLSKTLYRETVESLESSVVKTVGETLASITKFISDHGSSAIDYIKDVFDEDAKTNEQIDRTRVMIDYIEKNKKMLLESTNGSKFRRDLQEIDGIIYEAYTNKWNGLKDHMSQPERDMSGLVEIISILVLEIYPEVTESINLLVNNAATVKRPEDIDQLLSQFSVPKINTSKLSRWVEKHIPANRVAKVEGTMTELQRLALTVRTHVKSLENNRAAKVTVKRNGILDTMLGTQWATTGTVASDIMKRARTVSVNQNQLNNSLSKLAGSPLATSEPSQQLLSIVLELLSIVRGFGALIDTVGVMTITKRVLVNDQLTALSEGSKAIHTIVKNKRSDLTVGEMVWVNKLITELKSKLSLGK